MKVTYASHSLNWKLFKDNIETDLNLGDLTVVNAARQSFNKQHEVWDMKRDSRLIKYLAENNHWSPFAHPTIQMNFEVPFSVYDQLEKHRAGIFTSQMLPIRFDLSPVNFSSQRYVNTSPKLYVHKEYRQAADNAKQGSKNESITEEMASNILEEMNFDDETDQDYLQQLNGLIISTETQCVNLYDAMIKHGVCPEQARGVLLKDVYTNYTSTGSLYAWARVCNQRLDPHAQKETRIVANMIYEIVQELYPVSWEHIVKIDDLERFKLVN